MQRLCHENDALFIAGRGADRASGSPARPGRTSSSACAPDLVAFAKKIQVGGVMAGRRVDEVPENVFKVSGRINSTWGGGLVDMVRSRRILEIIERDGLVAARRVVGEQLLAGLRKLQAELPDLVEQRPRARADVRLRPAGRRPSVTRMVARIREDERGAGPAVRRAVDQAPPGPVRHTRRDRVRRGRHRGCAGPALRSTGRPLAGMTARPGADRVLDSFRCTVSPWPGSGNARPGSGTGSG